MPHVHLDEQTQAQIKSREDGFENIDNSDISDEDITAFTFAPKPQAAPVKPAAPVKKEVEKPKKHLSPAMQAAIDMANMVQIDSEINFGDNVDPLDDGYHVDPNEDIYRSFVMLDVNNRMMASTAARVQWDDLTLTGTAIDLDDGEEDLDERGEFEQADLALYKS